MITVTRLTVMIVDRTPRLPETRQQTLSLGISRETIIGLDLIPDLDTIEM